MKTDYVCPICQSNMRMCGGMILCEDCGKKWEIKNNIPNFSEYDYYWNQISENDMDSLINEARIDGWKKTIVDYLSQQKRFGLLSYILDESRSDGHFYVPICERSNAKILDIGCGWGTISIGLARWYEKVYCADTTLKTLEFSQIRAKQEGIHNIEFLRISPLEYTKLPFSDSFFDLVVLNGVLEWIGGCRRGQSPELLQQRVLNDVFRVLKLEGTIYIGIENRFSIHNFLMGRPHGELPLVGVLPRNIANMLTKIFQKKEHRTYIHSKRAYTRMLRSTGFTSIKFYWSYPNYRFPKRIVPLFAKKVFTYWRSEMVSSGSLKSVVYRLLSRINHLIFCHSFVIIAAKGK